MMQYTWEGKGIAENAHLNTLLVVTIFFFFFSFFFFLQNHVPCIEKPGKNIVFQSLKDLMSI